MNIKIKILISVLVLLLLASIAGNVYLYKKVPAMVSEQLLKICNTGTKLNASNPQDSIAQTNIAQQSKNINISQDEIMEIKNKIESETDPVKQAQMVKEFQDSLPKE